MWSVGVKLSTTSYGIFISISSTVIRAWRAPWISSRYRWRRASTSLSRSSSAATFASRSEASVAILDASPSVARRRAPRAPPAPGPPPPPAGREILLPPLELRLEAEQVIPLLRALQRELFLDLEADPVHRGHPPRGVLLLPLDPALPHGELGAGPPAARPPLGGGAEPRLAALDLPPRGLPHLLLVLDFPLAGAEGRSQALHLVLPLLELELGGLDLLPLRVEDVERVLD